MFSRDKEFAPAYVPNEFKDIHSIASHIVFNSFSQWLQYKNVINQKKTRCGMRINPDYSEVKKDIYNPCSKFTRFGVRSEEFLGQGLIRNRFLSA